MTKIPVAALRRLHCIHLPTVALLALLQRMPVVRVVASAGETALRAPVGSVFKSIAASLGALGAVHSLAGATTLSVSSADPNPSLATVGSAKLIVYTVIGSQAPPASFTVGGNVPPGMAFFPFGATTGGITTGTINASTIQLSGIPQSPGSFAVSIKAWQGIDGTLTSSTFSYVVNVAATANTAPIFTTQPTSQTAPTGGAVVFFVVAAGSPTPTYAWQKNGVMLPGRTGSSLTLSGLSTADAANYVCVATNSIGSATSNAATLTVTGGATAPMIATQPSSTTAAQGGSAAFNVSAAGVTGYQWRKNSALIFGATGSTLSLNNLSSADAATYDVVLSGSGGTTTTSAAATLLVSTGLTSRLSNVAVRTTLAANQILTVGFTMQGGAKPLLVRAAGPSLGALGVLGTMADPKLALFTGASTEVASNENWGGASDVLAASVAVGAFPFTSGASLDAALVRTIEGGHTVQVSGPASGNLIVEGYDAGTGNSPRLTNLSALNRIGTGADVLIAGFTIAGTGTKNVLIRAVGPSLIPFGVTGTLADPKLQLFTAATPAAKIGENDNYSASLPSVFASVGAFALTPGGKDAALIVSLPPGGYTVQVSGADGGTGVAIVEVYELP